jgi:hypothetical protein
MCAFEPAFLVQASSVVFAAGDAVLTLRVLAGGVKRPQDAPGRGGISRAVVIAPAPPGASSWRS